MEQHQGRRVDRVDAVEMSAAMVETGRRRPGGDHPALRWITGTAEIIVRHSRSPGYDPAFSLTGALQAEGLLAIAGRAATAPIRFRQPVADYAEHFHSTSSLARELMAAGEAAAFDRAVAGLVRPYAVDGLLDLPVAADLAWGRITATAAG